MAVTTKTSVVYFYDKMTLFAFLQHCKHINLIKEQKINCGLKGIFLYLNGVCMAKILFKAIKRIIYMAGK